jgi:hypothetical protein
VYYTQNIRATRKCITRDEKLRQSKKGMQNKHLPSAGNHAIRGTGAEEARFAILQQYAGGHH